jgi:hypothetical protein
MKHDRSCLFRSDALQDAEDRRRDFHRMLQEVEQETDRNGDVSLETALAKVDAIIAASE